MGFILDRPIFHSSLGPHFSVLVDKPKRHGEMTQKSEVRETVSEVREHSESQTMAILSSSLLNHPVILRFKGPNSNPRPSISSIPFPRFQSRIPSTPLNLRFRIVEQSQHGGHLSKLFANGSEGGDIVEGKSKGSETGSSQGPPFLTILAGVLVFLFIFWIIKSIVLWLVGLIVNVPAPK